MIVLFDIEGGVIKPTKHCYALKWLKDIMDEYPDSYMKIYAYLFYMSCPNELLNPYFDVHETDKEEVIYEAIDGDFSLEDPMIILAISNCRKLYETPTSRLYYGLKSTLDKIVDYMSQTTIDGASRDGNLTGVTNVLGKFGAIRESFKSVYKDLKEEQSAKVRGNKNLAYDEEFEN